MLNPNEELAVAPYAIQSGAGQVYRFSGSLLSTSDSRRPGSQRWISFGLYRTIGNHYVLSRVGHSMLYHRADCEVVKRNRLEVGLVGAGGVPCELCSPDVDSEPVCPEVDRRWAGIYKDPASLLAALQRSNGETQYVTHVAAQLIERAAVFDRPLAEAWTVQIVD